MNDAHVGDDAELYALGALEPAEHAVVEAHLAGCASCTARVGSAESVAAALARALPSYEPPARLAERLAGRYGSAAPVRGGTLWTALAVAAIIVAAFLGWQNAGYRMERTRESLALATLVHNHFLHVPMRKSSAEAPRAKVLYGRDGAWVYVVADRPVRGLHVVLLRKGVRRDAGTLAAIGSVASLLVSDADRPDEVMLSDASGPKNSATLVYPRSP